MESEGDGVGRDRAYSRVGALVEEFALLTTGTEREAWCRQLSREDRDAVLAAAKWPDLMRRQEIVGLQFERMTSGFPGARRRRRDLGWWRSRRLARRAVGALQECEEAMQALPAGEPPPPELVQAVEHAVNELEQIAKDVGVRPA